MLLNGHFDLYLLINHSSLAMSDGMQAGGAQGKPGDALGNWARALGNHGAALQTPCVFSSCNKAAPACLCCCCSQSFGVFTLQAGLLGAKLGAAWSWDMTPMEHPVGTRSLHLPRSNHTQSRGTLMEGGTAHEFLWGFFAVCRISSLQWTNAPISFE